METVREFMEIVYEFMGIVLEFMGILREFIRTVLAACEQDQDGTAVPS
jgi:hypothetical protein